jgi:hypothetical protein
MVIFMSRLMPVEFVELEGCLEDIMYSFSCGFRG